MKKKHRENLLKLAAYLDKLPDNYEQFHMRQYMMTTDIKEVLYIWEQAKPDCGTVACAVGHGPSAGIRVYKDDSWEEYADRVFGDLNGDSFTYMFGSSWTDTDNTPKGAAARIRTYVTLGRAPEDWTYQDAKVSA